MHEKDQKPYKIKFISGLIQQIAKSQNSTLMKSVIQKLSKKEMKQIAEKLAGPKINWMTTEERDVYIKGVTAGLAHYQKRMLPARRLHTPLKPESIQDPVFSYNALRLILP